MDDVSRTQNYDSYVSILPWLLRTCMHSPNFLLFILALQMCPLFFLMAYASDLTGKNMSMV